MKFFILLVVLILFFYLIGHILAIFLKIQKSSFDFISLFSKIALGLFATVIIYSVFKTSGKTINTGIIALFCFYGALNFSKIGKMSVQFDLTKFKNDIISDLKVLLKISPYLVLLYAWQYYFIVKTSSATPVVVEWDNRFVTDLAMFLNFSGKETLTWDYYHINALGNSPYHYFEGWIVGFSSYFLKGNHWLILQLVIIPLIQVLLLLGTWSVFERFKINRFIRVFSFSLIFISGFYFPFLSSSYSIFQYSYTWFYGFNAIDEPWFFKITIAYLIFISFTLLFIQKKYKLGLIILLLLPILSINTAPVILSTVFSAIFINSIFKYKLFGKIYPMSTLVYPIFVGAYILIFYSLFGGEQLVGIPKSTEILSNETGINLFSLNNLKILIEKIFTVFLLYLPFLLLILIIIAPNFKTIKTSFKYSELAKFTAVSFFILIVMGISVWTVLSSTYGSWEFFYTTFLPSINISIFFTIYFLIVNPKIKQAPRIVYGIVYGVFISILIFRSIIISQKNKTHYEQKYSNEFLIETIHSAKHLNPHGAKIQNPEDFYQREILFNPYLNLSAMYLVHTFDTYSITNLSIADADTNRISNPIFIQQYKASPIIKFIDSLKTTGSFKSINDAKLKYIKQYNVEYIVAEKNGEIDSTFNSLILKTIYDPYSEEKFVILKSN